MANQAMQTTPNVFASWLADRSDASLYFMKTRQLQTILALASGG
jgi:hypothetical protein